MTLKWKSKIVDDLIKEDQGSTIKDYLAAVKEIEAVEAVTEILKKAEKQTKPKREHVTENIL